ncbi:kinase-like protein, partial [Punctularia strigosozonata HHB-11173 SS5]|uniref:kinase-like protein n=1 Tax=Punctularia strigosozonata (strain HHB-11173) TaxID=741275 RepID=UPI0004417E0D
FCRESIFWKRLSHENIVPFLGTSPRSHVCIVAEWMEHGDVLSYLERFPLADRRQLITDVARGLNYMHASGVIHGDVKGRNILVDGEHHARLSDFGLSTTILGTETLASVTETSANRGSLRYMAPELLDHTVDSVALTIRADVYGFAMAMWEIFEGRIPFHEIRVDYVVVLKIKDGVRPPRPADTTGLGLDDEMWGLIQDCWTADPSQRPTMSRVLARLTPHTRD